MSNNETEPHPLPLTRAWVEDYKRWLREQDATPLAVRIADVSEENFKEPRSQFASTRFFLV